MFLTFSTAKKGSDVGRIWEKEAENEKISNYFSASRSKVYLLSGR